MQPYYTEEDLQEASRSLNFGEYRSRFNRIFPQGEPVARWELTSIDPIQFDLFPVGRAKESMASVYHTTAWHVWDEDGIGLENGGEEESLDIAMKEAFRCCLVRGFL